MVKAQTDTNRAHPRITRIIRTPVTQANLLTVLKSGALVWALVLTLSACGQGDDRNASTNGDSPLAPFIEMKPDLAELKRDFNAAKGKVRLLYLVGPTCGICLRGMADLDRELHAAQRENADLLTQIVHQPTLGATRDHVAQAMPLLQGPHVRHYWEDTGIIGNLYSEIFGIESPAWIPTSLRHGDGLVYVWDTWMIYGPEAVWDRELPPKPSYSMQQLGGFAEKFGVPFLDAKVFARKALAALSGRGVGPSSSGDPAPSQVSRMPEIAQPVSVAIRQALMGRGGYGNFREVSLETLRGTLRQNEETYPLELSIARDGSRRMTVVTDLGTSSVAIDDDDVAITGPRFHIVPREIEQQWLRAMELVSPLMDWKDKGHALSDVVAMERVGERLAWVLRFEHRSGARWQFLIDSHTGYELERRMLGKLGEVLLSVAFSDYRELEDYSLREPVILGDHRHPPVTLRHFVYPHAMTFRGPHGEVWGEATIDRIALKMTTRSPLFELTEGITP